MKEKFKISLKKLDEDYFRGPLFLYVYCHDENKISNPVGIDEFQRNLLLLCVGNKKQLYNMILAIFVNANEEFPQEEDIRSVSVDLYDNDEDATSGGNNCVDVWNFDTNTHEIDWDSYNPLEWISSNDQHNAEDDEDEEDFYDCEDDCLG